VPLRERSRERLRFDGKRATRSRVTRTGNLHSGKSKEFSCRRRIRSPRWPPLAHFSILTHCTQFGVTCQPLFEDVTALTESAFQADIYVSFPAYLDQSSSFRGSNSSTIRTRKLLRTNDLREGRIALQLVAIPHSRQHLIGTQLRGRDCQDRAYFQKSPVTWRRR
jgi:hypothetical protein